MNARSRTYVLGTLLLVASAAGCARAPRSASTMTPAPESSAGAATSTTTTSTEQEVADGSLVASLDAAQADFAIALDSGFSCDMVVPLRDRICMLADRVCGLAAESPDDLTMRAQCEDGASRCLAATEAVRRRCGP